jgi:hypothetical protein
MTLNNGNKTSPKKRRLFYSSLSKISADSESNFGLQIFLQSIKRLPVQRGNKIVENICQFPGVFL